MRNLLKNQTTKLYLFASMVIQHDIEKQLHQDAKEMTADEYVWEQIELLNALGEIKRMDDIEQVRT